jgi:hypothetical protein
LLRLKSEGSDPCARKALGVAHCVKPEPATTLPDYPKLAQQGWQNVATAVTGERTRQAAMDIHAEQMDRILDRLGPAGRRPPFCAIADQGEVRLRASATLFMFTSARLADVE